MTPLVIVGCGGFGREVVSIVRAINQNQPTYDLIGCLDDSRDPRHVSALDRLGVPLLGGTDWLDSADCAVHAIIGIGSGAIREDLDRRLPRLRWATLVHPDTTIGADVDLGPGTVVAPGARFSTAISLGRHVHVDQNATVGHDCHLSAYTRLNPQACVSGSVTLGEGVLIGANATVLQGLTLGAGCTVGAGAVVVSDVDPGVVVKGVPAR